MPMERGTFRGGDSAKERPLLTHRPTHSRKHRQITYGVYQQGWSAPKDFAEFYTRYPNFVKAFLHRKNCPYHLIEDYEHELFIYLMVPGETLMKRGFTDKINSINPVVTKPDGTKDYLLGNNTEQLFLNYLSDIILMRRLNYLYGRNGKEPSDPRVQQSYQEVHGEDAETPQSTLEAAAHNPWEGVLDSMSLQLFEGYVYRHDPALLRYLDAFMDFKYAEDVAKALGVSLEEASNQRYRLQEVMINFKDEILKGRAKHWPSAKKRCKKKPKMKMKTGKVVSRSRMAVDATIRVLATNCLKNRLGSQMDHKASVRMKSALRTLEKVKLAIVDEMTKAALHMLVRKSQRALDRIQPYKDMVDISEVTHLYEDVTATLKARVEQL